MKLFNHPISLSRRFFYVFTVACLLLVNAPSFAEIDIDNRDPERATVDFSQAELDQILAPIALYPDTILSQVLIAATYPIEVVQADRWARNNSNIKGADAVAKVDSKDWDPSVKALVAFPDILERMSDDIDWTQKLGDAFLGDEGRVMDSIQSLRKKAYASGSLGKVQHLKVQRDADEIVIEPAQERVVYVPVYDTRVVYGNWWWPDYPPVYWHHPASYVVQTSGFYWGPSIFIGPSFYYSSFRWRERHVVVVDHFHSHGPRPVFYTGRSIVDYHGARQWQHQPTHRRGVAYYNHQTRERFGSRQESYRDSHNYRQERRIQQSPMHMQPSNAVRNNTNTNQNRPVPDRSEQLRERLNQRNVDRVNQQQTEQRQRDSINSNRNNNIRTPSNQQQLNNSGSEIMRSHNQQRPQNVSPPAGETNNLGATRPTLNSPNRTLTERAVQQPSNSRIEAVRNREIHQDGRAGRPIQSERAAPRQERVNPSRERASDDNRPTR